MENNHFRGDEYYASLPKIRMGFYLVLAVMKNVT